MGVVCSSSEPARRLLTASPCVLCRTPVSTQSRPECPKKAPARCSIDCDLRKFVIIIWLQATQDQGPEKISIRPSDSIHHPRARVYFSLRTYLLYQSSRDRMEGHLILTKDSFSMFRVRLACVPEHGSAELHPALHDARTVVPDDPVRRCARDRLRLGCRRVEQCELQEAEAQLGVRGRAQRV